MTKRVDFIGKLDGKKRTPQGGLLVSANLTRTGVFVYHDDQGKTVREYRSPEEVFKADSLETLKYAPLVVGHPAMVRADNYQRLSVGVIGENVRPNGIYVASDVRVQDAATVAKCEDGSLAELSCGYEVDLVMTPGTTPDGEHYDALQTNIRYNHVGLGPVGWGRAGKNVRLLDGGHEPQANILRLDSFGDVAIDSYDAVKMTVSQEKFDAEVSKSAKLEAERDALKIKADALEAELVGAKALTGKLIDPQTLPSLVAARVALQDSARSVLGAEFKADGLSDTELMTAALVKHDPTFKADGRSADYLKARFEIVCDGIGRSIQANAALNTSTTATTDASTAKPSRLDAAIAKAAEEAKKAHVDAPPAGALVRK